MTYHLHMFIIRSAARPRPMFSSVWMHPNANIARFGYMLLPISEQISFGSISHHSADTV